MQICLLVTLDDCWQELWLITLRSTFLRTLDFGPPMNSVPQPNKNIQLYNFIKFTLNIDISTVLSLHFPRRYSYRMCVESIDTQDDCLSVLGCRKGCIMKANKISYIVIYFVEIIIFHFPSYRTTR